MRNHYLPTLERTARAFRGTSLIAMNRFRQSIFLLGRRVHTHSHDGPTESLKKRIIELEKKRRRNNPKKDKVFVEVPEPKTYLDTASMPITLAAVGIALFAKLLMMYDDSRSQELIERKIKNAPAGQGSVRMLTREEWEDIREIPPRTPFESKLARPKAKIRTGEPLEMEDVKNWAIDVLADALTRAEDIAKHGFQ